MLLLLSGSAGTGAECVGVTDSRGAARGPRWSWDSLGIPRQFGAFWEARLVVWSPRPARHRLSLGESPGEVPVAVRASRLLPGARERDAMGALHPGNTRAIPDFPVLGFGCPGSPVSRANRAAGAGCAGSPSFQGSISCRAAAWPLPPYQELSQSCRALFDIPVAIGTT